MSQNSFQQMRRNFAKQKRRQQLQQIFRSKRKQNSQKLAQNQKQTFINLLPNIDMENYEDNRFSLSDYARSRAYSYQMLPIAFISFEYLLKHPLDSTSWKILTYLSDYEDFQIPQTQEFAQIYIEYLNQDPQLISEFLFNISKLPKCSLLCCRLIDASIFCIIESKLYQIEKSYIKSIFSSKSQEFEGKQSIELQVHNFLFALSQLFSIQPMIEIDQMNKICDIVKIQKISNKFLKEIHTQAAFNLIQNAVTCLSHQPSVIKLLNDKFQPTLYQSFFSFTEESLNFIDCCIKNKVRLSQRLIKNVFTIIKYQSKSKLKINILKIIRKILDATKEKEQMQVEPKKFSSLEPLIEKNVSISLEDFNSMFSFNNSEPKKTVYQQELQNCMIVYSILFTQNFQQELSKLFQIFHTSAENVKEQITRLIRSIINCLIRENYNYELKRLNNRQNKIFVPEKIQEFLYLIVEQDSFFFWIEQCLKSTCVPVVENVLQILTDLVLYFREASEQIEEHKSRPCFSFFISQILKFSVLISLEDLGVSQNPNISGLAQDFLAIIEQVDKSVQWN